MVSWKGADFRYMEQNERDVRCSEEAAKGKPRSEAGPEEGSFVRMQFPRPISFQSAAESPAGHPRRLALPSTSVCLPLAASRGTTSLAPLRKEGPDGKSLVLLCRSSPVIPVSISLSHCHHEWLKANIMATKLHFPAYAAFWPWKSPIKDVARFLLQIVGSLHTQVNFPDK